MNLQLGRAIQIVFQTMPYVIYRAIVHGAICACVGVALPPNNDWISLSGWR